MEIDFGSAPGAEQIEAMGGFTASGSFSGDVGQLKMDIAGQTMETVTTKDWSYVRLPGHEWLKIAGGEAFNGVASGSGAVDPKMLLKSLGATGARVLAGGNSEIDGVEYDRVTAKVDLGDLLKDTFDEVGKEEALGSIGFDEMAPFLNDLDVTVWVDRDRKVVRRLTVDMGEMLGHAKQTIDYSDWGDESIRIEPPADAREVTFDEYLQIAASLAN
jgi:hypothetical protein